MMKIPFVDLYAQYETIKTEIINGDVNVNRNGDIEKSKVTNKFV